jgi:hypothetical protein
MSIAAIAVPVYERLVPGPSTLAVGQLELGRGFVALVAPPGTPWLPNAIVLGAGPPVVWDPVVAPVRSGSALAARGTAILRALGVVRPGDVALSNTVTSPPRAAVAGLVAALASGGAEARRRAVLALLGRGAGLTPEGDDLLAGAAAVAAATGDPLALPPQLRDLTTALSATLLELAATGAAARPVHALLDLDREDWRAALRELERLGASSGRAIALGAGAAAAALGSRRVGALCATLHA